MTTVVALDLGSTRVKAAQLSAGFTCDVVVALKAPDLRRDGLICECDADAYLAVAAEALDRVTKARRAPVPVGLSCQRSSFLLWDRHTGIPVTPLVSWQDRRAAGWCPQREAAFASLSIRTGLRLSPHYAGPKLAYILKTDPQLRRQVSAGSVLFGTLDTYALWKWSGGTHHETDISMAARTLLADPVAGVWAPDLLDFFGIPPVVLPQIVTTTGRHIALGQRHVVTAGVADQAAGLVGSCRCDGNVILVNLGTGGFVIRPVGCTMVTLPGYLTGALWTRPRGSTDYALEGTVNGIGAGLAACGAGKEALLIVDADSAPDAYCLPDTCGLGSPHWLPEVAAQWSDNTRTLPVHERRRIYMEGIVFRVTRIINDLDGARQCDRVVLAGGLSRNAFIVAALATTLDRPLYTCVDPEASLRGAGALALGAFEADCAATTRAVPREHVGYAKEKYLRWLAWCDDVLGGAGRD